MVKLVVSQQLKGKGLPACGYFKLAPHTNHRQRISRLGSITILAICVALSACSSSSINNQNSTQSDGQNLPAQNATAAQTFVDATGVVTHLNYTDTAYFSNWGGVLNALQALGVKHIRDGYGDYPADSPLWARHQQLKNIGITTDYVVTLNKSIDAQALEQFATRVTDMEAIEAPNECDTSGLCGVDGVSGIANAIAVLPTLHAAAQYLHVPLIAPSFALPESYAAAGNIASNIDLNNLHVYFGGRNPGNTGWGESDTAGNTYGSLNFWYDVSGSDAPSITPVITESGYISFPATSVSYTIPESVQTAYVQRTLLLGFMRGYKRTFIYELMDDPSSPAGYGLLRPDMSHKPAFIGMSNMLHLLSDTDAGFTPEKLPLSITGGGSTLNHLLLQKKDGSYWLVLWLEAPSWDPVTAQPINVAPEDIQIKLDSAHTTVSNYQFSSSGSYHTFDQPMNIGVADLTVTDQISIVKIVAR